MPCAHSTHGSLDLIVIPLLILTPLGPGVESLTIAGCVGTGGVGMNVLALGAEG